MRLSEKERKLLFYAELDARISTEALAQKVGVKQHTARYYLQKLVERRVIRRYAYIDIYPMGLEEYGLFFSLSAKDSERSAFFAELQRSPHVAWVLETAGDYNFGIAICVRRARDVTAFLEGLSERFGGIIVSKSIAVRVGWSLFGRKYLCPRGPSQEPLRCGFEAAEVVIDESDQAILSDLVAHPGASSREIASRVSISPGTVQRRMRRLEDGKVLVGDVFEIDPRAINVLPYRLLLSASRTGKAFRNDLYRYCQQHPEVVALIECIGSWDYELKVEVEDITRLPLLTGKLYQKFGADLREIRALSVIDTPKLVFYPNINV